MTTEEQFEALLELIREEAAYAARDLVGRTDCSDWLQRDKVVESVRSKLVIPRRD